MAVTCPKCQSSIDLPPELDGGRVNCPTCGAKVRLGSDASEAADASPAEDAERPQSRKAEWRRLEVGAVIGGCQIEEMLGAGAMGLVYRAKQLSLQRQVAVKILPTRLAAQPKFVERFDRESAALASLNHPNIISIIDRGHDQGTYFFVMEYVSGRTLRHVMKDGPMPEGRIFQVMEQICSALSYAQRKGIVHRDIKPRNIMVNDQGRVKIADFGLAFLIGEESTKGKRYGTAGYMSPEQRKGSANVDGRSDLYSTAVVFYEMLVCKRLDAGYVEPSRVRKGLSPAVDYVLCRGLQKDPARRYQNPIEMLTDIRMSIRGKGAFLAPCPQCGTHNEPTQKTCANCQADLSDLFDACPDCGHDNRGDMSTCAACGYDLKARRKQLWTHVIQVRQHAAALAKEVKFDEAEAGLRKLTQLPGKEFRKVVIGAEALIEPLRKGTDHRLDAVKERAQDLVKQHKYAEALMMLESFADLEADLAEEIALARDRIHKRLEWADDGDERWQAGDLPGALKAYKKAYEIWPDNDALKASYAKAKAAAKQVAEKKALVGKITSLREAGKLEEALSLCAEALADWPDGPGLSPVLQDLERGQAQAVSGQAAHAGDGLAQAGKWRDAVQQYSRAAAAEPDEAARARLEAKMAEAKKRLFRRNAIIAGGVLAVVVLAALAAAVF